MLKLNQRGITIVEVLVSALMAMIVSLGVATMMQNQFREGRRTSLMYAMAEKRKTIDFMLRDPNLWSALVNNNANPPFTTLRKTDGTPTAEIAYTTPVEFQIYNAGAVPTVKWDLLGPSDISGASRNGFTEKGAECSTFVVPPASGNDSCPFSYRLLVAADCAGAATSCTNPQLKLVARLVFNPSSSGALANFAGTIGAVSGAVISDTVADGKYDSVIKRTSTSINRSFKITSGFTPAAGCASTTQGGGGLCTTVGAYGAIHPRTAQAEAIPSTGHWDDTGGNDPADLVTIPAGAGGTFRFNETGFYGCVISVPAFATNAFTTYLMTGGAPIAQATVTAAPWSQSVAVIENKFYVTSTSADYQINQKCESAAANYCSLGIPSSTYGSHQVVVSVSCYKLDKAF